MFEMRGADKLKNHDPLVGTMYEGTLEVVRAQGPASCGLSCHMMPAKKLAVIRSTPNFFGGIVLPLWVCMYACMYVCTYITTIAALFAREDPEAGQEPRSRLAGRRPGSSLEGPKRPHQAAYGM